jgi:amidophosphoribosyltransferase
MIELPTIMADRGVGPGAEGVRDHCGVFGVYNHPDAARLTYFGLHALQHRGQESAGIVTSTFDEVRAQPTMLVHRDFGLVLDVFRDQRIFEDKLLGDAAIGHTRYSTSGSSTNPANIQPFTVHYQEGNLAVGHNGNLSNARSLRAELVERGTLFNSSSDTELILHLVAQSSQKGAVNRIIDALHRLHGAFTLVILTDEALIAVRDPNGFRPLAVGRIERPDGGAAYCVASETCAFDIIGATYVRDVDPGEILIIDREGIDRVERGGAFNGVCMPRPFGVSQCVFEYVYFSRPDSKIFGEMVDKVRRKMGKQLAHEAPPPGTDEQGRPPIVFSVPDSSNTAALGYVTECQKLGHDVRYEIGLIRNHYVGRTFIAPGQDAREMKVRTKFNAVEGVLKDRIVVMVDDSIVRGTTAKQLVKMVRDAGACEVHFRVASPPVISPCFYGMDFPTEKELLANQYAHDRDAMRKWLGVDSLGYLSIQGMMDAAQTASSNQGFCNACFSQNYPVPVEIGVAKEENEW